MDPSKKKTPAPAGFMSTLTRDPKGGFSVIERSYAKIYGNNRELSFMGREKAYGP
jgi:hypothetical protein